MRRSGQVSIASSFLGLILCAAFVTGCDSVAESLIGTDVPDPLSAKPECPGHPSCQDPVAPAGDATADISGNVLTTVSQPVVISKDSKNFLAGSGGDVDYSVENELSLISAAVLDECVKDPEDMDETTFNRLVDRLDDAPQLRTFRFTVNRKDPSNMRGGINQSWIDDDDGRQYRTRITESSLRPGDLVSVSEGPTDEFTYSGGSVVSWDMTTGEAIACPNTGSVTLSLTR
jgi:hypothetical protein